MEFEWDESKRIDVIRKHNVDFVNAALIFEGPVHTRIDDRRDYGEIRYISTGMVGERCYVVVHTDRDGAVRLISAWRGGQNEVSKYQASLT